MKFTYRWHQGAAGPGDEQLLLQLQRLSNLVFFYLLNMCGNWNTGNAGSGWAGARSCWMERRGSSDKSRGPTAVERGIVVDSVNYC